MSLGLVVAIGLAGCGSSVRDAVVVRVGERAITAAMVEHWIHITAVTSYEAVPKRPVPPGVVPDPPRYSACIVHLREVSHLGRGAAAASKLKRRCLQEYRGLRQQALRYLIDADWIVGESASLGVMVTSNELSKQFAMIRRTFFPTRAAYTDFFKYSGETVADRLFGAKLDLLSEKINKALLARQRGALAERQKAVARYLGVAMKRWIARTSCVVGYVVPECRQYRAGKS